MKGTANDHDPPTGRRRGRADEAVELAVFYLATGMVNSTGSIGRFVDDIVAEFPVEMTEALGVGGQS